METIYNLESILKNKKNGESYFLVFFKTTPIDGGNTSIHRMFPIALQSRFFETFKHKNIVFTKLDQNRIVTICTAPKEPMLFLLKKLQQDVLDIDQVISQNDPFHKKTLIDYEIYSSKTQFLRKYLGLLCSRIGSKKS